MGVSPLRTCEIDGIANRNAVVAPPIGRKPIQCLAERFGVYWLPRRSAGLNKAEYIERYIVFSSSRRYITDWQVWKSTGIPVPAVFTTLVSHVVNMRLQSAAIQASKQMLVRRNARLWAETLNNGGTANRGPQ